MIVLRALCISCSLLIAACGWNSVTQQELTTFTSSSKTVGADNVGIDGTVVLSTCEISLGEPYFWRDWQHEVLDPGPDGGSPLRVAVVLEITNHGGVNQQITWEGTVKDGDDVSYPVEFTDRSQTPQNSVILSPGQKYTIHLIGHDGPYLPVESKASLNLSLTIDGKNRGTITSTQLLVNQTM